MNINISDSYLQTGMNLTLQQRQNLKQQSEIQKKLEEIANDKTANIYQQQADAIRENRNLNELSTEETQIEKKQEEKKQKDQYEEKAQQLTRVYGSDTAEIVMQLDALMQNAMSTESDTTDSSELVDSADVLSSIQNTNDAQTINKQEMSKD